MNKVIPLAALLFSAVSLADNSGANASASGSVYQVSPQTNLISEQPLPVGVIGETYASCATSVLSVGVIGNHSDAFGNIHSASQSLGVSFSMPVDTNGVNERCEKQQVAINRLKQIEIRDRGIMQDDKIISMCLGLRKQGVIPDPAIFTWADKCHGLIDSKLLTAFQK